MVLKLVDTSVAVDHLRGHEPAVSFLTAQLVDRVPLAASEVVRFELLAGARPQDLDKVEAFCAALDWVPVTEAIARRAAAYAREYRTSHSGIDDADYLIAATADVVQADLLSRNLRHFPMFADLSTPY